MSIAALVLSSVAIATAAPPPANAPLPKDAASVAAALTATTRDLRSAEAAWAKSIPAPESVVLYALYQQRLYRLIARDTKLSLATLPRLRAPLRRLGSDLVAAHRELYRLTPPLRTVAFRVGAAAPAATLLTYYREAERKFRVPWNVLAAVNFVESKFGKLRNASAAGAQGPMQFMPATWRAYGMGGNLHDPHDAILGAANYLRASGAPRDVRRALHAYNPSPAYVDAVLRYARALRTMFFDLYNWQVFVKTSRGDRRLTGPGLP